MGAVLLIGAILGIGVLLGWGFGGALRNVAHVQVAGWPAFPVGLALQAVPIPHVGDGGGRYLPFVALVASYVIIVMAAGINWRLRWFPTIMVGVALNAVPIVVNQGMPVSGQAVREVGGSVDAVPRERGQKHHLATGRDELAFLGDVIPVREPFQAVVSLGDLVMYVGAAGFLAAAMLGRHERRPRSAPQTGHSARPSSEWESPPVRSSPAPRRSRS